ncbi:hypothetical protein [Bacillus sp. JJ1562]|uniref:hypothetical protein n=1 Tax=Bacillus sp. JJ1562 TaxID=3122960 RepID=UPI003002FA66
MKKIIGFILTFYLLASVLYLSGRYFYISKIYTEPFDIVGELVNEAKNDKSKSVHLIGEEEWEGISENSTFSKIRQPISWESFKEYVQNCEAPAYSLSVDEGKASYDVMRKYYKDKHRTIDVVCFEYNKENGQQMGLKDINLLVENIQGSWKVVGKPTNK